MFSVLYPQRNPGHHELVICQTWAGSRSTGAVRRSTRCPDGYVGSNLLPGQVDDLTTALLKEVGDNGVSGQKDRLQVYPFKLCGWF
jgi:hypothetical protein